ncbi:hypothetical protein GWG54_19605 [Natronococcus sp. JC468]|uniref:HalOD1 output domain-containing protein n=1 Tax=Natronococcus sp. JC468 TaxID=1961921 RepID=UPI00143A931B|nr:HalOD1 output domain-containing protein [Natronococcus sp. JC468]NKE37961.1 hypothetical protein [Natronococcus sp. JC468]
MTVRQLELTDTDASTPSEAIVLGVAGLKELDPTTMPPLYERIDPEALDSLFHDRSPGTVTFEYAGYEVTVRGCERATLRSAST